MSELDEPVITIRGVGPKISSILEHRGVETVGDAIRFYPRRYEDRRPVPTMSDLVPGEARAGVGKVRRLGERRPQGGRRRFEVVVEDEAGTLTAVWFHYRPGPLKAKFKKGERLFLYGRVEDFGGGRTMVHPDAEMASENDVPSIHFERIVPVYSEPEGIAQRTIRRIMCEVTARCAGIVKDPLPKEIRERLGLVPLGDALEEIHFPGDSNSVEVLNRLESAAHRRLIFDELFTMQLGLALRRDSARKRLGNPVDISGNLPEGFLSSLDFSPTDAQRRAVEEVRLDMSAPEPMYRLLQGDVGCGKTTVAAAAILMAVSGGRQAAVMAPTEILASQHARSFDSLLGPMGVEILSLTGGMDDPRKRRVLRTLAEGRPAVVVGTQALVEDNVSIPRLGLCIIDEGHRFGVSQRERLLKKGRSPDLLVMTATPIPRSLALTLYGDLYVTWIDEMPPGRVSPRTMVLGEYERERAYGLVREELERGGQGFVVYPVVEENENLDLRAAKTMATRLPKTLLPGISVAMVHGRMDRDEREEIMGRFAAGEIEILVATTVIEVGIDMPQATIMVVENAERFGLAQLHQLRGRVGRGGRKSRCLLISGKGGTEMSAQRLRVMEETSDGFKIAEEDLRMRGPGELLGMKQSGLPDLVLADLVRDFEVMKTARREAFSLVAKDPGLKAPENRMLRAALARRWGGRLTARRSG